MKKIILAVALVCGVAFTEAVASEVCAMTAQVEAVESVEFQSIDVNALPQPVKDAIAASGEGKTAKEAYVSEKEGVKVYKVVIADAEGNTVEVLYGETGEVMQ